MTNRRGWKAPVKEGVWGLSSRRSFWPSDRVPAGARRVSCTFSPDRRRRYRTSWQAPRSVVPRPRRTKGCDRTCEEVQRWDDVSPRTGDLERFSRNVLRVLMDSVRTIEASGSRQVIGAAACETCAAASARFPPSKPERTEELTLMRETIEIAFLTVIHRPVGFADWAEAEVVRPSV